RAWPAAISYDLDNPAPSSSANINLIGLDGVYTGISPFGPWSITVGKQSRSESIPAVLPMLDHVRPVLMMFYGKYQPFDPNAPAGPVRVRRVRALLNQKGQNHAPQKRKRSDHIARQFS